MNVRILFETVVYEPGFVWTQKFFSVSIGVANLLCEEAPIMCGPGEYRPDPTEGIPGIEALPAPLIMARRRTAKRHGCPPWGHRAYREQQKQRLLHDLGDWSTGRPQDLQVTYAQDSWTSCRRYCPTALADLAPPNSAYTPRVIARAVRIVVDAGWPYRPASWPLWRDHRVCVPCAPLQNWGEAGGKKGAVSHGHGLFRLGMH